MGMGSSPSGCFFNTRENIFHCLWWLLWLPLLWHFQEYLFPSGCIQPFSTLFPSRAISSSAFSATVLRGWFAGCVLSIVNSACTGYLPWIVSFPFCVPSVWGQDMWSDLNPPDCILVMWQSFTSDLCLEDGLISTTPAQFSASSYPVWFCYMRRILIAYCFQDSSDSNVFPERMFISVFLVPSSFLPSLCWTRQHYCVIDTKMFQGPNSSLYGT